MITIKEILNISHQRNLNDRVLCKRTPACLDEYVKGINFFNFSTLYSNTLKSLDGIEVMANLETILLYHMPDLDYTPLKLLPKLKKVGIFKCGEGAEERVRKALNNDKIKIGI
jgi:hypothetical protein